MKKDDKKNDMVEESEVIEEAAENQCEDCAEATENTEDTRIAGLEAKCNEYLDLAQRIKADFENYKKRTKNAVTEAYDDGTNDTAIALLPVLDNLERAMAAMKDYENDSITYYSGADYDTLALITQKVATGRVFNFVGNNLSSGYTVGYKQGLTSQASLGVQNLTMGGGDFTIEGNGSTLIMNGNVFVLSKPENIFNCTIFN